MRVIHGPNDSGSRQFSAAPQSGVSLNECVARLDDALAGLQSCMKSLAALADDKLIAMRRADADALHACAAREANLLQAHFASERTRDAVLADLAQHLPALRVRPVRLSAASDALPEPAGSRIRARMQGLREVAGQLQKKNAIAADVARKLQSHIREVFAAVSLANQETVVYGRNGQHETAVTRQWVDAVG